MQIPNKPFRFLFLEYPKLYEDVTVKGAHEPKPIVLLINQLNLATFYLIKGYAYKYQLQKPLRVLKLRPD